MKEHESYFNNLSLKELKENINTLIKKHDALSQEKLTYALGTYLLNLQRENNYSPVFPLELIPLPRVEMKKWGFDYAMLVMSRQSKFLKYQQDAALCYTFFQPLSEDQWSKIKSGSLEDLVLYHRDIYDNGKSDLSLPTEYEEIVKNQIEDYNKEKHELFAKFDNIQKETNGCLYKGIIMIAVLAALVVLIWYFV